MSSKEDIRAHIIKVVSGHLQSLKSKLTIEKNWSEIVGNSTKVICECGKVAEQITAPFNAPAPKKDDISAFATLDKAVDYVFENQKGDDGLSGGKNVAGLKVAKPSQATDGTFGI